jgi:hypothetical protein
LGTCIVLTKIRKNKIRKLGRPGKSEGPEKEREGGPMKKALYGFPQLQ